MIAHGQRRWPVMAARSQVARRHALAWLYLSIVDRWPAMTARPLSARGRARVLDGNRLAGHDRAPLTGQRTIERMEDDVSLRRAAELTGLGERTIRRMVKDGRLAARVVAVNLYAVRVADLPKPKPKTIADLTARLEQAEAEIKALKEGNRPYSALRGDSGGSTVPPMPRQVYPPPRAPDASATRPLPGLHRGTARKGATGAKMEVCRWLADGHGVKFHTAKGWVSADGMPTERRAAFAWALAKERRTGWRKGSVDIHHCDRIHCECQTVPTD